jgi:hypothetical protein
MLIDFASILFYILRKNYPSKRCISYKTHHPDPKTKRRYVLVSVCLSIYPSMALQSFCWPLAVFPVSWSYTVSRTPWTGDQSVARPLHTHRTQTQNKRTQISMPWVGFKPTIPSVQATKIVHALDGAATVIGTITDYRKLNITALDWSPVT